MGDANIQMRRGRATGKEAIKIHAGLVLALLLCIPAGIFEFTRAIGGNTLSWAYTFEWPIFGGFAVYMWWRLLNGDPVVPDEISFDANEPKTKRQRERVEQETIRLEQWNDYLRELERADRDSGLGPSAPRGR